ncbi:ABC transporter ATP-binding protein [Microvirga zambiensis]|uniref:ABC transporter ATP-binding protein n=1 Tax=Microvirga zambiensis TaxID=1402137 RepID=UPI00191EB809|nr:ABC transporter ATP-binding protein [Microvirga zambiensis]
MEIELRNLAKSFGATKVVNDLSFSLEKGEMIALLGPSGCGKTTTLRMVAGFIGPTSGAILVRGQDVTRLPPHKRDSGLVFQNYALFPHMTVTENIAFGLNRRGIPREEQKARIAAMVEKLKLKGLEQRYPKQLSGGQQQRVAVARALVINPAILLLDEPFSNLDAKLRESTGIELRRIQRELGLTSIFVTHDQNEAMAIADKIAVMNGGVIEQLGSASEIYETPATRFVAEFIGKANFLTGSVVDRSASGVRIDLSSAGALVVPESKVGRDARHVEVMIRPENVVLTADPALQSLQGVVDVISYQGATAHAIIRLPSGLTLMAECKGREAGWMSPGGKVFASLQPESVTVFRH